MGIERKILNLLIKFDVDNTDSGVLKFNMKTVRKNSKTEIPIALLGASNPNIKKNIITPKN